MAQAWPPQGGDDPLAPYRQRSLWYFAANLSHTRARNINV